MMTSDRQFILLLMFMLLEAQRQRDLFLAAYLQARNACYISDSENLSDAESQMSESL